jgi:hypothetical protein
MRKFWNFIILLILINTIIACDNQETKKEQTIKTVEVKEGKTQNLNHLLSFYHNVLGKKNDEVGLEIIVGMPPNEKKIKKYLKYDSGLITFKGEQDLTCNNISIQDFGRNVQYTLNECKGDLENFTFFNSTKKEIETAMKTTGKIELETLE